jgi:hypothetical protein
LQQVEDKETMALRIIAVPVVPHHMTINLTKLNETANQQDASSQKPQASLPFSK